MFSKQLFFFSFYDILLPPSLVDTLWKFFLFLFLLKSKCKEFLLPKSFDLAFVLDFFHSTLLLSHLFKLIFLWKSLEHSSPKMLLHAHLLFFLPLFSFSCLFLSHLHLNFLLFSLLNFLSLFASGLILKLFLIILSSQVL